MWKDVLRKMPVPIDTVSDRDESAKKEIVDYEKQYIEPYFTSYVKSAPAGTKMVLVIQIDENDSTDKDGNVYTIGGIDLAELGNSKNFIYDTLKEIYENEGYSVNLENPRPARPATGPFGAGSREAQPEKLVITRE